MRFISFVLGMLFILLALLARQIGIDHDAAWGTSRYLLLLAGLALAIPAALVHLARTGKLPPGILRTIRAARRSVAALLSTIRDSSRISIGLAVVLLAGASIYAAWYTSNGMFPLFRPVTNPYVDLGEAFLHGQVALLDQPDPRLAALANPYDEKQRENVPFLWDTSYYKGKYYIYWGPVPAVFNALIEAITRARPPEQLALLCSYIGLGVTMLILLFHLRKWYAPRAPGISVVIFLLAALANLPYIFLLGRSQVYETSVIAGQLFLTGGLFAWLVSINKGKRFWLVLAGLSWGLAIGSRYNLALSVGIFGLCAMLWLWRRYGWTRAGWQRAAALFIPLALCGLGLALYNYVRFESPFETGLIYQLTIPVSHYGHFSPAYVPASLYMYLFYPLSTSAHFPFFPSIPVQYNLLPAWAARATGQGFDEVFVGAIPGLPVLWLLVVLAPFLLLRKGTSVFSTAAAILPGTRKRIQPDPAISNQAGKESAALASTRRLRLAGILGIAGAAQFAFLLFYYYGAMRFNADYYLMVLMAVLLAAWELDEAMQKAPAARTLFWLAAALLALVTAGPALLAGFDIPPQFFRAYNPVLFGGISRAGDQIYNALAALPESPGLVGLALRLVMKVLY